MTVRDLIDVNDEWSRETFLEIEEDQGEKMSLYTERVEEIILGTGRHDIGDRRIEGFRGNTIMIGAE